MDHNPDRPSKRVLEHPWYDGLVEDEAVIAAVQRGDRDAFTILVDRYQDRLYSAALRLLGSPSDAADVVQETFTRAFVHVHELRPSTLKAWLFRVATNCARDQQRRVMRRPTTPLETEDSKVIELPDRSAGPEEDALALERSQAIKYALAELSFEHREVVVLRDINDLSYEEIAAVLKCPVGTVRSRLNRGRAQLVEQLRQSPSGLFAASGDVR